ncbi:hypothetical protein [uncultured Devosia sp.]|uniref:hypothetical protein n=1 Tax=uncultured Devosia sp. TaxID=211434 RepID=UPI0035CB0C5D
MIKSIALAIFILTTGSMVQGAEPAVRTATLFEQQFPLTTKVLTADFPQDLRALQQAFSEIDRSEVSPPIKLHRAFQSLTALRKVYSDKLQYARADMSALLVLGLAGFYDSVLQRDGADVCGGFAVDGAGALFALGRSAGYGKELDVQAAAYFAAVASALEDPDVVGQASEADWAEVMGQVVARGNPASYIATMEEGRAEDPDLCPALAAFFYVLADMDSDAGKRARAELIQGLTGY